jgi:uncharacterized repeat protein (TIGR03943 family)
MNPAFDRCLWGACWICYLLVAGFHGRLDAYLAAWQHPILWIATGVLGATIIGSWINGWRMVRRHGPLPPAHRAPVSVLLFLMQVMPLALLTTVPSSGLGSHAFAMAGLESNYRPGSASAVVPDSQGDVSLVSLFYPDTLTGRSEISAIGLVHHPTDEQYQHFWPATDRQQAPLLLYRFLITCCAADAAPIYVGLHRSGITPSEAPNGTWIRVHGTWTAGQPPQELPLIQVSRWETIAPPADPYLDRILTR